MYLKSIVSGAAMLAVGVFGSGCGAKCVLRESVPIKNAVWCYRDSANFKAEISNPKQKYNIYLDITHDTDYPFENAYLSVTTQYPSGKRQKEQISLQLADKAGLWLGSKAWFGNTVSLHIPVQKNATFAESGKYSFTIAQNMRQDSAVGVHAIGVCIDESSATAK